MNQYTLHLGNCLEVLKGLPDSSVDSVVTDPPYGLSFMGKKWDYDVPDVEVWAECLRVLKPGGHLLAFAGTRTQHRMAVRIEDSGFELRDMVTFLYDTNETAQALIESLTPEQLKLLDATFGRDSMLAWTYGSGFPKSMDVSKAIDKAAGVEREIIGVVDPRSSFDGRDRKSAAINTNWRDAEGRDDVRDLSQKKITSPSTDDAKQWQGWGTALKPALEPITVARKPFKGTVAANVLAHGTGAINIDGCRVEGTVDTWPASRTQYRVSGIQPGGGRGRETVATGDAPPGRWPANLIHDGSDEVLAAFPEAKGQQGALTGNEPSGKMGAANCYGKMDRRHESMPRIEVDKSAARFFYCAKTSRKDRNEGLSDPGPQFQHGTTLRKVEDTATAGNNHPTVKPTDLMAYLCRLVTPPGGTVLDPFMGSGSTGKAAMREGFCFIGIELDEDYMAIAEARIAHEAGKA